MKTITLGSCDVGKKPSDPKEFLKHYHSTELGKFGKILQDSFALRDDSRTEWKSFDEKAGNEVVKLQQFLKDAGFMPRATADGVFGYVTQAATRLFQEYVRTMKGVSDMVPDGRVGPITWDYINNIWPTGEKADWGKEWSPDGPKKTSSEFEDWRALLNAAKVHYKHKLGSSLILSKVENYEKATDTIKLDKWNFDPKEVHLIGISRQQEKRHYTAEIDDVFILLINGQVFKFYGSTDPSLSEYGRQDKSFLVEGQHKYRFGWHGLSKDKKGRYRIYRALKAYSKGVLIMRNQATDTTLDNSDLGRLETRTDINIHWSGLGISNWSSGCQVIAGKSYMNHLKSVVDCSGFAARNYGQLKKSDKTKTKGAYNVLTDLILCYAGPNTDHMFYTLGKESSLVDLGATFGDNFIADTVGQLKNPKPKPEGIR